MVKRMVLKVKEPQLSVVVPTRNESENIQALIDALRQALHGVPLEVIIVDDSDDDTLEVIDDELVATFTSRWRLRAVHRATKAERLGGLATAVTLGMSRAQSTYIAVIDADLQHPPEHLRQLLEAALTTNADIVVATRYRPGGSYEGLDGFARRFISVGLKSLAQLVFPDQLLGVSDPLGGFFMVRRSIMQGIKLRPIGYKISMEVMLRCRWKQLTEVPYTFRARAGGESKSNVKQGLMVFQHMLRLLRELPAAGYFWKYWATALASFGVLFGVLVGLGGLAAPTVPDVALAGGAAALCDVLLNSALLWRRRWRFGPASYLLTLLVYALAVAAPTAALWRYAPISPVASVAAGFFVAQCALYRLLARGLFRVLNRRKVTVMPAVAYQPGSIYTPGAAR